MSETVRFWALLQKIGEGDKVRDFKIIKVVNEAL